jgi:hypothetical protein
VSDIARTLRAVAEVIVPGKAAGERTDGAPEVAAENFLSHYLDFVLPGLAEQVCALLDTQAGGSFALLSMERRTEVLDALADHEAAPMRSVAEFLTTLSVAATYSEWSGLDAEGDLTRLPLGWELTGYVGPVRARPDLLRRP